MAPTAIFAVLAIALVAGVNAKTTHRLINRRPAAVTEFPYQVSVKIWGEHFCGGAIVSAHHIVTAAHCVATLNTPLTVITSTISTCYGEILKPTKIEYHQKFFDADYPHFDIAVITIQNEMTFNTIQNMIALPTVPTPVGVTVTTSGWGYLHDSVPMVSTSLYKIRMKTISVEQCQQIFGSRIRIYTNQICTYRSSRLDVCAGDSGGPLAFNGSLIGILSWGMPCSDDLPHVFTSIYHLLPWVNSIINT